MSEVVRLETPLPSTLFNLSSLRGVRLLLFAAAPSTVGDISSAAAHSFPYHKFTQNLFTCLDSTLPLTAFVTSLIS
jgi:hypothetical protein